MGNSKETGGFRPEPDDIEAFNREKRTRISDRIGDVPEVSGSSGGGAVSWLVWIVILALAGGAYYLYQQLDLARAQLTLDQQRISRLEKQLNVTDESVSESSDMMQKQMQFMDKEIRKLWDNVWKKSKEQLEAHETKIAGIEKSLASLKSSVAAVEASVAKDKKELAALKIQQQKTQSMAETNWSEIADLRESGDVAAQIAALEKKVKANEDWLASVNAFRKQVNSDLSNLRSTVSSYHSGTTGSAPAQ